MAWSSREISIGVGSLRVSAEWGKKAPRGGLRDSLNYYSSCKSRDFVHHMQRLFFVTDFDKRGSYANILFHRSVSLALKAPTLTGAMKYANTA